MPSAAVGAGHRRPAGRYDTRPPVLQRVLALFLVVSAVALSIMIGRALWDRLPDPVAQALAVSLDGVDEADLAVARRVLADGTRRLEEHLQAQDPPATRR